MPSNRGELEPIQITRDTASLFRSASRLVFHDERYWIMLKVGSIATAIAKENVMVEKVNNYFNLQGSFIH